ncbi:MAG: phosphoribosylaminoimidazolesuccinocarboxamide synthase [Candidatus Omnitrophica bacterium]|nr:phosphoribosylaminoimidazolesuccinocarboxamide synthase [Candidatus Omnitrophota bacterium]
MNPPIYQTNFEHIPVTKRGKVRDLYDLGENLLIVASDRISCFDVVLPTPIPQKGMVLTQISLFWFEFTKNIIENHLISNEVNDLPDRFASYREMLSDRIMIVKKVEPLAIECVIRGYLAGSGFKEYKKNQSICGIPLPPGLRESDKLPQAIFTPSTKATSGHDENISHTQAAQIVGKEIFEKVKKTSLTLYTEAARYAQSKGIIIADTKFEFGLADGKLILIDEILTPDSSRFWPKDEYQPGRSQVSFDKQFVRDYLETMNWDKNPPAPALPAHIVQKTQEKYRQGYALLTGHQLGAEKSF